MMTLNHGFSGYVCGRVAIPVLKRYAPISERAMGWAFFIGAMMPDGDVLTRLIGGRGSYFGGAWYSHRQFSHSFLGTLVYALLIAAVLFGPMVWRHEQRWRAYAWTAGCLWVGGWLHLLGDMVTPSRALPIFWPSTEAFGGWAHIGWFSPYLLVIFLAVLLVDVLLRGVARLGSERWQFGVGVLTWGLYAATALRWFHYMTVSRYEGAAQWAEYQRSLLPEALVSVTTDTIAVLWSMISK